MSDELYSELSKRKLLDYGSMISGDLVREILGIEYPEYGRKEDFESAQLREMAAIDYVRNILLGEGKYLSKQQGDYRVLLPSENEKQVLSYMQQADKKLRRALKLNRNTPKESSSIDDHSVRIFMKRDSIRRHRTEHAIHA
ncbi:hypothetical protein [Azonexus sp. IMCC34839]|uniref:hypothetical protein n=1 Tax=Azonexus sp. IMCC34839 TaxID=3133695 RepID=UPI00399A4514